MYSACARSDRSGSMLGDKRPGARFENLEPSRFTWLALDNVSIGAMLYELHDSHPLYAYRHSVSSGVLIVRRGISDFHYVISRSVK